MSWQPISTAPKDGTRVLLFSHGSIDVGYWSTSVWLEEPGWIIYEDRGDTLELKPTHWMTLPEPPKEGV